MEQKMKPSYDCACASLLNHCHPSARCISLGISSENLLKQRKDEDHRKSSNVWFLHARKICLSITEKSIEYVHWKTVPLYSENQTITMDKPCMQNSISLKVKVGSTTVLWKIRSCLIPVGHWKTAVLFSLHIKLSLHSQWHIGLSKQLKACFQLEGIFVLYNVQ